MVLPDHVIQKRCDSTQWKHPLISPFKQENLQPASVDLTLDDLFLVPITPKGKAAAKQIDLKDIPGTSGNLHRELCCESFTLFPLSFVLASTVETVHVPPGLVGRVEGKSSLGRLALFVHCTAGFIDPGFRGTITLEMFNANERPIQMWAGQKICQISFTELSAPAQFPYGHEKLDSKYQGQSVTTASRYVG